MAESLKHRFSWKMMLLWLLMTLFVDCVNGVSTDSPEATTRGDGETLEILSQPEYIESATLTSSLEDNGTTGAMDLLSLISGGGILGDRVVFAETEPTHVPMSAHVIFAETEPTYVPVSAHLIKKRSLEHIPPVSACESVNKWEELRSARGLDGRNVIIATRFKGKNNRQRQFIYTTRCVNEDEACTGFVTTPYKSSAFVGGVHVFKLVPASSI
ncbi:uncharacterized protein [Amphiura filiformis]|uniref:uncharacterized protein n=1 Tax=Amphiura filiformis TaxID=82378 RepID=UPI003B218C25